MLNGELLTDGAKCEGAQEVSSFFFSPPPSALASPLSLYLFKWNFVQNSEGLGGCRVHLRRFEGRVKPLVPNSALHLGGLPLQLIRTQYKCWSVIHCHALWAVFYCHEVQCDAKPSLKAPIPLNFNDCLEASGSRLHQTDMTLSRGQTERECESSISV